MSEGKNIVVSYGPNELEIKSGTAANVADLRKQVFQVLSIPDSALAEVDGIKIEASKEATTELTPETDKVNFVKESGRKAR